MFYQFTEDAPYVRYNSDKAVNALSSDEQDKWHFWDGTVETDKYDNREFIPNPDKPRHYDSAVNQYVSDMRS